ncbi:unnamed protein product [Phytophthora fragariaefolia]|uniref:Unnamed protein product n=1 Tax=Phytophthora fragariaefolia TaxID=1490495 RepID=A0A9W6WST7_9STRA|nr:unnamed protein product [Phytophthora fragariaefolia]
MTLAEAVTSPEDAGGAAPSAAGGKSQRPRRKRKATVTRRRVGLVSLWGASAGWHSNLWVTLRTGGDRGAGAGGEGAASSSAPAAAESRGRSVGQSVGQALRAAARHARDRLHPAGRAAAAGVARERAVGSVQADGRTSVSGLCAGFLLMWNWALDD